MYYPICLKWISCMLQRGDNAHGFTLAAAELRGVQNIQVLWEYPRRFPKRCQLSMLFVLSTATADSSLNITCIERLSIILGPAPALPISVCWWPVWSQLHWRTSVVYHMEWYTTKGKTNEMTGMSICKDFCCTSFRFSVTNDSVLCLRSLIIITCTWKQWTLNSVAILQKPSVG